MARKPKPKSETKSNGLLEALKFCGLILKDAGPINETHVILDNQQLSAFNSVLAVGHRITEDIKACPQNKLMIEALSKCGDNLAITQLDNNRLSIKSNKFKALVPCVEPYLLQQGIPDEPVAVIDNGFKEAIQALSGLNSEDGQTIYLASILMNGHSLVATTGTVLIEVWHGIHLPSGIPLPKAIIQPLSKINKNMSRFGFSNNSVTFWFDDGSWLKTQTYAGQWPSITDVLDKPCHPGPVPADFWTGLDAVGPFSGDGNVHFGREVLQSHLDASTGASYEMPGLPAGPIYPIKQLQLIRPLAETVDFLAPGPDNSRMLKFFGKSSRGVVAGQRK